MKNIYYYIIVKLFKTCYLFLLYTSSKFLLNKIYTTEFLIMLGDRHLIFSTNIICPLIIPKIYVEFCGRN